jgi:diguanylate cyclase (GGDEF)-like protein
VAWNAMNMAARLADAEHRSGTDALTGLANRERLQRRATVEFEVAAMYGHPVAIAMGDLDYFKRVNDTMGHLAGDEALRVIADLLRRHVDDRNALAARYGGEEFLLLMPAVTARHAFDIVERIREDAEPLLTEYRSSISWGISELMPGESFDELIDRADQALYASKLSGKNCTTMWSRMLEDDAADKRAA